MKRAHSKLFVDLPLPVQILAALILACISQAVLSESATDTNLHETVTTLDLGKNGTDDYRRQEVRRGDKLILTTICQGKSVTHAYHIGEFVFLEHDANGDGLFKEVSILKDNDVIEAFIRSSDGKVRPLPSERLRKIQSSFAEAKSLMTNLVDAVINENSEKVEQIIENIRKREQTVEGAAHSSKEKLGENTENEVFNLRQKIEPDAIDRNEGEKKTD